MVRIFLSLGSNLGDREKNIVDATKRIEQNNYRISRRSPIYETTPIGNINLFGIPCPFKKNQPDYLNCVVEAYTDELPRILLKKITGIEKSLKRKRILGLRNLPRTIDIDILFYGDMIINQTMLKIPHPRLHQRLFVLLPLADLAPDYVHPVLHKTIKELIKIANPEGEKLCPYHAATTSL